MKKSRQSAKDKKREKEEKRSMKIEKAPVAMSQSQRFPARGGRRSWRFTGSELIGDVVGSTNFRTTRYPINPGLDKSFPWLSGEADKWEQYRFHSLRYRYVPRCATTTTGSVLMSPDYNVRDNPPQTELQAADTYGAVESSAWVNTTCTLDIAAMFPFGPRKMIRQSLVAGELNLYDAANFYMSTIGMANSNDLVGKLWVDYDVEFFIPQNSPADNLAPSTMSFYTFTSVSLVGEGVTSALTFSRVFDPLRIDNAATSTGIGVFSPRYPGVYRITFVAELVVSTASVDPAEARFAISLFGRGANPLYTANVTVAPLTSNPITSVSQATISWLANADGDVDYYSFVAAADQAPSGALIQVRDASLIFSLA